MIRWKGREIRDLWFPEHALLWWISGLGLFSSSIAPSGKWQLTWADPSPPLLMGEWQCYSQETHWWHWVGPGGHLPCRPLHGNAVKQCGGIWSVRQRAALHSKLSFLITTVWLCCLRLKSGQLSMLVAIQHHIGLCSSLSSSDRKPRPIQCHENIPSTCPYLTWCLSLLNHSLILPCTYWLIQILLLEKIFECFVKLGMHVHWSFHLV